VDPLTRHAQAHPDLPALIEGERRLSWRAYHEARNRLAHALGDLGLDAGQHVVLYAPNSIEVLLYEFYGSTEIGVNTVLEPHDMLRKPHSCGRAAPGGELAVLDEAGQPLPPGQPGELHGRRSAGMFEGYYKNPQATRETARGDWLSVGDVAWIDAEGFVYVCDRKRDMIISGGVNIYPAEIEDVLHRHPAVEDVAVFGVPDPTWGERIHAAIQRRADASLAAAEIIDFCRRHLADFKTPREVSFHDALPRDTAGKLVKRVLREPHWSGRPTHV
jgi:acyl-CoA synthetase (AMP-forming)/AMP-acid ligase II